ncbi:hypothetical protein pipiens_009318 [Culex pipiens pipiens]|uniref:Uncharacterized protein n=1 Tax=Culex pipiens pipiens TaxID=38569 RepID=A0ABD1DE85_CULPP
MLQDMVMSKSQTDVYEAIDFFTSAYLFGIKGTESGMQQNEQFQCRAMELRTKSTPGTSFRRNPRPDFDASREELQRLGEGEGNMTKEEFKKVKEELEAEYLVTFKKTVTMQEVFLT